MTNMMIERYRQYKFIRNLQRKLFFQKKLVKKNSECKCLVLLHLFYDSSWPEINEYLKNLSAYRFDLFVSVTRGMISPSTIEQIKMDYPEAKIVEVENKGYDLAPFFELLKDIDLNRYDVVFKLHSKSTKRKYIFIYRQLFFRRDWFVNLYEGILSGKNVHRTIDILFNQKQAGLIAAKNLIVKDPKYKVHLVKRVAEKSGIKISDDYSFVAGTCFAIKAECLKQIQELHLEKADYSPVPSSRGLSFAHFAERLLCDSVNSQGYLIKGNSANVFRRALLKPLTIILNHYSSERLFDENIDVDDDWFFWQMDNKLIRFKYVNIRFCDINYISSTYTSFLDGAPYKYVSEGDVVGYEAYCKNHLDLGLPIMTKERFDCLIDSINKNGFDEKKIIIIDNKNGLLDGQHRACVLANQRGESSYVRVLKIWDIMEVVHGFFSHVK